MFFHLIKFGYNHCGAHTCMYEVNLVSMSSKYYIYYNTCLNNINLLRHHITVVELAHRAGHVLLCLRIVEDSDADSPQRTINQPSSGLVEDLWIDPTLLNRYQLIVMDSISFHCICQRRWLCVTSGSEHPVTGQEEDPDRRCIPQGAIHQRGPL